MNRTQLEHIIRAASQIFGDTEIVVSKYAAGREKDLAFNRELARHGLVSKRKLTRLVPLLPIDDARKRLILDRIKVSLRRRPPPSLD